MIHDRPTFVPDGSWVFLTGGSGFLGQEIIRDLRAHGFRVKALVRSAKARASVERWGAEAFEGELDQPSRLAEGMKGCAAVIHAAAKVEIWGPWEDFERVTVQGTKSVLEAADQAGVPRFIHISTEAVLADGRPLVQVDEDHPLPQVPNGPYPKSKGLAEKLVLASQRPGRDAIVVRPRFIWGRGDTTLLPQLVTAMKSGQWVWFGPDHEMSTCHVSNVAHGVRLAMKHGRAGQVYFLTDGASVPFRDFITRLVATQGVKVPQREAPLWVAELLARLSEAAFGLFKLKGTPPMTRTMVNLFLREVTVVDSKARNELGYQPPLSVDEGLRQLTVQ